ncbi:hypothetical protein BJY01DRAFT_251620 [Aspergillus pseudoustus]|uniref:Invertebrate defensins family profile domain-containing protein n=1 Tax=Aspergillus pseudoustus TaxID=1810923 RepID=A0ABR4JC22_9EURO
MRPILIISIFASLLAIGATLPPREETAEGNSDSKTSFAKFDFFSLFKRQSACDNYSAGLCGCFCRYNGYAYYKCAKDYCACYDDYSANCYYAYYYYSSAGYPAPNEYHPPVYPQFYLRFNDHVFLVDSLLFIYPLLFFHAVFVLYFIFFFKPLCIVYPILFIHPILLVYPLFLIHSLLVFDSVLFIYPLLLLHSLLLVFPLYLLNPLFLVKRVHLS